MGEHRSDGHELFGFISGISKHNSLVPRAELISVGDAFRNIIGLWINCDNNTGVIRIESIFSSVIANAFYGFTN